ncbi:hypothetical protein TNCV_1460611 [Trichonephila clavipes]|nr:hypothetical protein TNCV_1460611 [Trichonephila clavipes]
MPSFKKCCITNALKGTEDDTMWKNADAGTHAEVSSANGSDESFSKHCSEAAPAREDCVLLLAACHNGYPDRTLSAAVRIPFFLSMDTRGESETYKKGGTDKDYTTNT